MCQRTLLIILWLTTFLDIYVHEVANLTIFNLEGLQGL